MYCAKRQAQLLGNLAASQAAPEHQLDHIALSLRQLLKRLPDLAAQQRFVESGIDCRQRLEHVVGDFAAGVLAAPAAQLVDRAVVCDREQPGGQTALAGLVAIEAAPAAHEHILRDLLSRAALLDYPQGHAEDQPPIAIVERGDAGDRLLAQLRHQIDIARRRRGSHFIHNHSSLGEDSRDRSTIVAWNRRQETRRQETGDNASCLLSHISCLTSRVYLLTSPHYPSPLTSSPPHLVTLTGLTPTTSSIERQAGTALVSSQSALLAATRSGCRSSRPGSTPTCSQAS